jgi:nucleoprotein TPR
MQKEIELKEIQARLDQSVRVLISINPPAIYSPEYKSQELAKTRESLVGAEISKKHLEERVEELTRQLQGNQEKLAVYERRPGVAGVAAQVDQDLNHEQ